ncbi:hypothetical protein EVAR_8419_1 [Eumeta japonica]|uniref:Uncharacterized protein n=1 Tax=Eumeta variegata TaxID=151549 RepID=A0A4C1WCK8_EUMVA|nr:hypothetical protein EVAR_8419_1 [Eumeta japonica]
MPPLPSYPFFVPFKRSSRPCRGSEEKATASLRYSPLLSRHLCQMFRRVAAGKSVKLTADKNASGRSAQALEHGRTGEPGRIHA